MGSRVPLIHSLARLMHSRVYPLAPLVLLAVIFAAVSAAFRHKVS